MHNGLHAQPDPTTDARLLPVTTRPQRCFEWCSCHALGYVQPLKVRTEYKKQSQVVSAAPQVASATTLHVLTPRRTYGATKSSRA